MNRPYQQCTRCLMDTTDPDIIFDGNGHCNHCRRYALKLKNRPSVVERQNELEKLVSKIKKDGKNKEYDCVIGVSGGVDSTYVAYLVKQLGLRPLAVHMDNGWNSELAVSNIEKFLKKLGIDLCTVVLDWDEFKDLQLSFLKASTSDAEIPTDHAIWAVLNRTAAEIGIRYVILADNWTTELILPPSWTYGVLDWQYIKSVHAMFGKKPLKKFPHLGFFDQHFFYRFVKKVEVVHLLDYVTFEKQEVMRILEQELDWRPYGGKHYESIYTRFFQGYILPRKFNIDKRKAHLSSLIMANQITRDEALAELQHPPYAGYMLEEDMEYFHKKLELTGDEFDAILSSPPKTHKDYQTFENYPVWLFTLVNILNGSEFYRWYGSLPESIQQRFRDAREVVRKITQPQ